MHQFQILGQSNFGISVLLDCLVAMYPGEELRADIVANLPAEQNTSLAYAFETPGVHSAVHFYSDWTPAPEVPCIVGSIGKGRRPIFEFFRERFGITEDRYFNTIHPSAVLALTARMGRGVHISPLSVIAPFAELEDFVVVNRNASIGHHTVLERFATINPGVNVAGACRIGAGVTIGAGATVVDQITIGAGSIIGAGSLVTRDIPAGVIAYGNPAKVIREINPG
jgi:sugar O-acyltransferase (sialic acid O-acetyltransferase NeuD family)